MPRLFTPHCRNIAASVAVATSLLLCAGPALAQSGQRNAALVDAGASQLCVDTINSYRARLQLRPLARWVDGESAAAAQALADSRSGVPHGAIVAFEQTPQGRNASISQNECPGYPGTATQVVTQCTAQMWAEGPGSDYQKHGHYLNLSNPAATKVACGFATAADGTLWATQNLTPYSAPLDPTHSRQEDLDDDNSRPVAAKFCLDSINSYRSSADLPAYQEWPEGEQCASRQAALYARGGAPDLDQDACLAGRASGQSVCASSAGTLKGTVADCLKNGWNEGPGADFQAHGDYLNMSSRQYSSAACGFARGADGSVQTVQLYK